MPRQTRPPEFPIYTSSPRTLIFWGCGCILLLHFIAAASSFWNGRADDIGSTVPTVEPMVFHPAHTAPFYRFILLCHRTYVLVEPGEYKKTSWNFTSLFLPLCICEGRSSKGDGSQSESSTNETREASDCLFSLPKGYKKDLLIHDRRRGILAQ